MIEVMIETWSNPKSGTTYRWSVWNDGSRVGMGGPHGRPEESEAEAGEFCVERLKRKPDRVTRL